jgi:hypothetical protein
MEDPIAAGWRLYKANLAAKRSTTNQKDHDHDKQGNKHDHDHDHDDDGKTGLLESHPPETIVSAQFLELIQREGVRRFVVHAGRDDGLLV